jgi:hypothetical protein
MGLRGAAVACAVFVAGCEALFPLHELGPCEGYCDCLEPKAAFCDDFERGDLGAWTRTDTARQGAVTLVNDVSVSPTHALHVEVPAVDTGGRASLHKDFPNVQANQLTIEFDVNPRLLSDDQILSFQLSAGYSAALVFSQAEVGAFEKNDAAQNYAKVDGAPTLTVGAWQHVVVTLRLDQKTIAVRYGADPGGRTFAHPLATNLTVGEPSFDLGAVFVQNSPDGWSASFDNVVLRYE